jgi:hypothetical protein
MRNPQYIIKDVITANEPLITFPSTQVDFNRPELCAQTTPLTCSIYGIPVTPKKWSWGRLLAAITERLLADRAPNIELLYHTPLYGRKKFFLSEKSSLDCIKLSTKKWICVNYNSTIIIRIIKSLCQHCEVDLNNVIITYQSNVDIQNPTTYPAIVNKSFIVQEKTGPVDENNSGKSVNAYLLSTQVDFNRPELCDQTTPLTCSIYGIPVTPKKWSWDSLLAAITERLLSDRAPNIELLYRTHLYGHTVFFFSKKVNSDYIQLSNKKWINVNFSPKTIIMIVRKLCQHCEVDLNNVIITYQSNVDIQNSTIYPVTVNNPFMVQVKTYPVEANNSEQSVNAYLSTQVDFNRPELCAQTKPLTCSICGMPVTPKKWSWGRLLAAITERLLADRAPNIELLYHTPLYGGKKFFLSEKSSLDCIQLSTKKWICVNFNSTTIIKIIKLLCQHCEVDLTNVIITYQSNVDIPVEKSASVETEDNNKSAGNGKPQIDEAVCSVLIEILGQRFPNGIRPNSIIDTNKLKNYYLEATGKGIFEDISDIAAVLEVVGLKHGEKVFAVSLTTKSKLEALFSRLLAEKNRLFYYDELYDAHADFFEELHIFSSELLKTVLSKIFSSIRFYKNYCQTEKKITVESEILRCFESDVCLSYDQLKKKLPYIPITSIRQVLSQNDDFVWVNPGVYTILHRIEFDKSECEQNCRIIAGEVSKHGFTSLATVDVCESLNLNPELSETAIRNGLYLTYLSYNYEKYGNIVTAKGTVFNAVTALKKFCCSHNRLSLNELLEYEKTINGDIHSQSLIVAYDNMVRVDHDTFVADSEIKFDVAITDAALARFVYRDVIPLRAVKSFTSFPLIDGYQWNWFLLESYCRRFSKRFSFQCLSVSSRNVGAIYKKSVGFADYTGVLAAAASVEPIMLNYKEVGDFLFESGYVARRTSIVTDVVKQAQIIRESKV